MERRTLLKAGLTVPAVSLAGTALASPADNRPRITGALALYAAMIGFLALIQILPRESDQTRRAPCPRLRGWRTVIRALRVSIRPT